MSTTETTRRREYAEMAAGLVILGVYLYARLVMGAEINGLTEGLVLLSAAAVFGDGAGDILRG